MNYQRLKTLKRLQELARPWVVATRGKYSWEVRCRFAAFAQASAHAIQLREAFGLAPEDVTVSSIDDGAELFDLEWAINRAREQRLIEANKVRPDPTKMGLYQNEIQYLLEEAHLLAHWRGWELETEIKGGLMRLSRGSGRIFSVLPPASATADLGDAELEVS